MNRLRVALVAAFAVMGLVVPPAAQAIDGNWLSGFTLPGPDKDVECVLEFGEMVVVGGEFNAMGALAASNIAALVTSPGQPRWITLGDGLDGRVFTLAEHEGVLYAGGMFSGCVARWHDGNWEAFGSGLGLYVSDLESFGDDLYAVVSGGTVQRWDGTTWTTVVNLASVGPAKLAVQDGVLWICGGFTQANGTAVDHLVGWNGVSIVVAREGLGAGVWGLAVYHGDLVACGNLSPGGLAAGAARWNGEAWERLGAFVPWNGGGFVDLAVHGDQMFASYGVSYSWEGPTACELYSWTGEQWQQLGATVRSATVLEVYAGETGLWIGGSRLAGFGQVSGHNLMHHDGSEWVTLFPDAGGIDGTIYDLAVWGNEVIAVGNFMSAGPIYSPLAAAWNGWAWSPYGNWATSAPVADMSTVMTRVIPWGADLIGAGDYSDQWWDFYRASWTPNGWHELDDEIVTAFAIWGGLVSARAPHGYGDTGEVLRRSSPDGTAQSLGVVSGSVSDLTVWNDDLIAVGAFTAIGGIAVNDVARLSGTVWTTIGSGVAPNSESISSCAVYGGDLVVGGTFNSIDGVTAARIARYDGTAWHALGEGINGQVMALASFGPVLIAAGSFTNAGGQLVANIAAWDGQNWSALRGGLNAQVNALAVMGDDLYAGGEFTRADGVLSSHLARWHADGSLLSVERTETSSILSITPNPCNPEARIEFTCTSAGPVRVGIHDLRGRRIRELGVGEVAAGRHSVTWDGRDGHGAAMPSGAYLVRLTSSDGTVHSTKVMLTR